jgi:glycerol-3-phosphate dehydrogenase
VTVFGGKLTDCLNVGREVVDAVASLGILLGPDGQSWYGEPPAAERDKFLARAVRAGLGERPVAEDEPSLAALLWRRHGRHAADVVAAIEDDLVLGEPVLRHGDMLRAELGLMAEREMVTTLADFLRRRTKLGLIVRHDELAADPGMAAAATALFGAEGPRRLDEAFGEGVPPSR